METQETLADRPKIGLSLVLRRKRVATIVATAVVLAAVLMPGEDIPKVEIPGLDKIVHILLFGCWSLALRFDARAFRAKPFLLVLTVAAFAPMTELMQLFAPGRSFELLDIASDLVGAAIASAFGAPVIRLAERVLDSIPGKAR